MKVEKDAVLSEIEIDGRPFIGKTVVLSVDLAKQFQCDKPWVGISIASYKMFETLHAANRIALLQLAFPDIDRPKPGREPFTYEQAHQVYNFIHPLWNVAEVVMVHCEGGLSRSSAIAAALHKVYIGGDNDRYWRIYRPNSLVYSTMLKVAVERGLWDFTADPDTVHVTQPPKDPAAGKLVGD